MSDLSPAMLESLNNAIKQRELESVGDVIRNNAAPCLSIIATGTDDYGNPGNTRFGGDPDLPTDAEWPTDPDDDQFANFIAQINFSEFPVVDGDDVLPKHGILFVFVRYMECAADPVVLETLFYDGDQSLLEQLTMGTWHEKAVELPAIPPQLVCPRKFLSQEIQRVR